MKSRRKTGQSSETIVAPTGLKPHRLDAVPVTRAYLDGHLVRSSASIGAQGNETISGVFHEASPNSLFTLPVVNAFSNYPDSIVIARKRVFAATARPVERIESRICPGAT